LLLPLSAPESPQASPSSGAASSAGALSFASVVTTVLLSARGTAATRKRRPHSRRQGEQQ
jgi:hypothetical protein